MIDSSTRETRSISNNMVGSDLIKMYDYVCTCKGFHRMGWICSHSLVVMANDNVIKIEQ